MNTNCAIVKKRRADAHYIHYNYDYPPNFLQSSQLLMWALQKE